MHWLYALVICIGHICIGHMHWSYAMDIDALIIYIGYDNALVIHALFKSIGHMYL